MKKLIITIAILLLTKITFGQSDIKAIKVTGTGTDTSKLSARIDGKQSKFVINVNDYGAKGDGVTNSRNAIQAAFDAAPANSTIVFPDSSYFVSGYLLLTKTMSLKGMGGNYSLDLNNSGFGNTGTKIWMNSTTDSLLRVTAVGCNFEGLAFVNRSTTQPTTGYGIYLTNAGSFTMHRSTIYGFYNNFKIEEGVAWSITSSNFINPTNYNLYIRNPVVNDEGDGSILGCNFLSNNSTATGIRQESSGGLKVANCKFHPILGNASRYYAAIDVQAKGSTSILMVSNSSFEGFGGYGIRVVPDPGIFFNRVLINGNQFYPVGTLTGNCIRVDSVETLSITGNMFNDNSSNTIPAIAVNGCTYATLYPNQLRGWTNKFGITGGVYIDTTVTDAVLLNGPQNIDGAKTFNQAITVHIAGVGDVTMGGASIYGNRPVFYNGNNYAGGYMFFYGDNMSFLKSDLSTTFFDMATTGNKSYYPLEVVGAVKGTQYKLSALNTAPASSADTGTLGEIRVTASYIYVCTATNTWVRSALTTW